jgi:hypothetical protein
VPKWLDFCSAVASAAGEVLRVAVNADRAELPTFARKNAFSAYRVQNSARNDPEAGEVLHLLRHTAADQAAVLEDVAGGFGLGGSFNGSTFG